jgi:hypothetical protein
LDQDSDNDQLTDYEEIITYGTNPFSDDTDGDSHLDQVEVNPALNTNPCDTFDPLPSSISDLVVYQRADWNTVEISWTKIAGCSNYEIYYTIDGSTPDRNNPSHYYGITSDNTAYIINGLQAGTCIKVKVVAISDYNQDLSPSDSNTATTYTRQDKPTLNYYSKSYNYITVQYFKSSTASEVQIWWDQGNGNWALKGTYSSSSGLITFSGLQASHNYNFKARQIHSGDSYWSYYCDILSVTTSSPPQPTPNAVQSYSGYGDWVSSIYLQWYAPSNYMSGWYYRIWIKPTSGGTYTYVNSHKTHVGSSSTKQTLVHTPPSPTTSYTYRICAVNSNGQYGPYSYWSGKARIWGSQENVIGYLDGYESVPEKNNADVNHQISDLIIESNNMDINYENYVQDLIYLCRYDFTSITIGWFHVPNASKYYLFMEKTNNGNHNGFATIQSHTKTKYRLVHASSTNEEITIKKLKKNTDFKFYMLIVTDQGYRITSSIQVIGTMKFTKGEQSVVTNNFIPQTNSYNYNIEVILNSISEDTFYAEYFTIQMVYSKLITFSQKLMISIGFLLSALIISESIKLKKKKKKNRE